MNFLYDDDANNTQAHLQKGSKNEIEHKENDDDDQIFTLDDTPMPQSQIYGNSNNNSTGTGANSGEADQLYFDISEETVNTNQNQIKTGARPGTASIDSKKKALLAQKERLLNEQKKRFSQQGQIF